MLNIVLVTTASLLWLGGMFAAALYAERRPALWSRHWSKVYALSLAVHCTSWTFYGTVTQAARYGWPIPPTFVGAILLYAVGFGIMLRLTRLARDTNAASLADLIATRLGKDAWLAATVTLVIALGLTPYIALQLKAVAMGFAILTGGRQGGAGPLWQDSALYVAIVLAVFAILFGARRARATEHNRGLVFAMAMESLFKLVAMLALGAFVVFGLHGNATAPVPLPPPSAPGGFVPLMLLGALAMFILPHQFHVAVVECRDERHVRTARWLFPLYLVLIALPVLPLARAGARLLGDRVPSDLYVLALPLSQGHHGLALVAFLGGLSAATGMVVVSTLSLSLMIGNHWFAPGLLRGAWGRARSSDLSGSVLTLRRTGIVAVMLLAWAYSRVIAGSEALADVGAVSFSALATLAPALAFAVWRPQTPARAAMAGILGGFIAWAWVLLLPTLVAAGAMRPDWLDTGPFGLAWLSPDGLFGLTGWSRLGRAVGASLFIGTATTLVLAASWSSAPRRTHRGLDAATLRAASLRFLPRERVAQTLMGAPASGPVPVQVEERVERELASVLGTASARVLLDAARRESRDLETVATIVNEASADLRFNQRVLEAALQNMSQGISVVDANLRLVAWNRRYAEIFGFPVDLLEVGRPIADLARWAMRHVDMTLDVDNALERRLAFMRAGTPHLSERVLPDGSIIEIRGNPMPGGGFVATFTDVTEFRRAEAGLILANETLEQRVSARTAALEVATHEAERANHAKSRFLAAIGHDLMQPLHAAQLFTDALADEAREPRQRATAVQIRGALDSTADLLTGLLDMSRLEAGGLVPQLRDFALADVLDPLASEFRAIAEARGLRFRHVPSAAWVHSDPQLVRRVLQNFLANAVRYTASGSVLFGVRRRGDRIVIDVHDTGPGIEAAQRESIFEEFRRGDDAPGQGLGLGLFIADRIASLLDAPLSLHSVPGRGTVFSVALPRVNATVAPARVAPGGLAGVRVLLLDNDPAVLQATAAMLSRWGCDVVSARHRDDAIRGAGAGATQLWLFDYHLDDGDTGVAVARELALRFGARPMVVMSADAGADVRAAVQDAGALLLPKPLKPLALKSTLDRLLVASERRDVALAD